MLGVRSLYGSTLVLPTEVVTASRIAQRPEHDASSVRVLDAAVVQSSPALTLDGVLRSVPSFSLFRRSDSLTANPTAQGVSLRGLGPSGASRSLVLLDGIPLNDPFGGWVSWTKVPRASLTRIEIVPGGGATAWGNAALGGVVQLFLRPLAGRHTQFLASAGAFGTRSIEFAHTEAFGDHSLEVQGRAFTTDGFSLMGAERRGPIDIPAWSRHRWFNARWRQQVGAHVDVTATVRGYEEKRGNGTPYQRNSSREKFVALTAASRGQTDYSWQAAAYAQDQSFASTFGAVNATRTVETPASDQFAVPATAYGFAWTSTWNHLNGADKATTTAGIDGRRVRGETREYFTFAAGDFTRQRVAGGRQDVAGVFGLHERPLAQNFRALLGARIDQWRDTEGSRRETDRVTGVILRDDHYANRSGTAFSPSLGLVWQPAPDANHRWRVNFQQAYRRPTLNELYRPFRVGPNVTEANADLRTEKVTSGEIGADWHFFSQNGAVPAGRSRSRLAVTATAFWNDLRDAVGNVTVARGPGTFPIVGFVAAGGVGRQRLNLERTRVQGLEFSARATPVQSLTLTADYLYNHGTIQRTSVAPALVGKRLAQVPRQSGAIGVMWLAPGKVTVVPRARFIGRQCEDDENQLILGAVAIGDISISRPITKALELFVTVENIGNARIETGRTADGLVNVGTPRLAVGGVRGSW